MRALTALLALTFAASPSVADTLRVAQYNASLFRNGPGILIRDLETGRSEQLAAVVSVIRHVRPDILLVNEFDFDAEGRASALFADLLASGPDGIDYPHRFADLPNTGILSGQDLNGDGKTAGPDDAFGYGTFPGQYGMLLLSRFPLAGTPRTFARLPWRDLPGARMPVHPDGSPWPSVEAQAVMRLSSKSHWDVAFDVPGLGPLHIYTSHPTPPVFDGPEDRNGLRNGDEIRFWVHYLDGTPFTDDSGLAMPRADAPFVLMGDLNADPLDGEGDHAAMAALLSHPALQDPGPASDGAARAGRDQAGANAGHRGDHSRDTADWRDTPGPGNLRVDYVLPARALAVTGSGVFWPGPDDPLAPLLGSGRDRASDHHLVWVDIALPR